MNEDSKLAYLAGIVDGEGCFSALVNKNGRGEPHRVADLTVVQKDRRLLDWIKQFYGGNVSKMGNRLFQWKIRGRKAKALALRLQPMLIVKDQQVFRCLNNVCEFCGSNTS